MKLNKDYILRYGVFLGKRRSQKQKSKFLTTLLHEIKNKREDIKIFSYQLGNSKEEKNNIYVGDIQNAKVVLCTYYDTPAKHFFDYNLINKKNEEKKVISTIIVESLIYVLLGFLVIYYFQNNLMKSFHSYTLILWIMGLFVYFLFLKKISIGLNESNTLIRNSSSLIYILEKILANKDEDSKIAYAFIDEGCINNIGLKILKQNICKDCKIVYLDSIGSKNELYFYNNKKYKKLENEKIADFNVGIIKIMSAREKNNTLYLSRKDLTEKEINIKNMDKINIFLESEWKC